MFPVIMRILIVIAVILIAVIVVNKRSKRMKIYDKRKDKVIRAMDAK